MVHFEDAFAADVVELDRGETSLHEVPEVRDVDDNVECRLGSWGTALHAIW